MKKLIIISGLVLLLVGGIVAWRAMNPPPTDEAIITANVEDLARTASSKRLRPIMGYLDQDFKYGTMTKKDLNTALAGAFWTYHKIDVQVSGVVVEVKGAEATSNGHYNMTTQNAEGANPETFAGDFKIKWRKQEDGEWKAIEAEGGRLPGIG